MSSFLSSSSSDMTVTAQSHRSQGGKERSVKCKNKSRVLMMLGFWHLQMAFPILRV
jgi:hypothetical protein